MRQAIGIVVVLVGLALQVLGLALIAVLLRAGR